MESLFITHVEFYGRFLRVYGQSNQDEGIAIEKKIQAVIAEQDRRQLTKACINSGDLCLTRYSHDGHFYRSMVNEITKNGTISVIFIDYGNAETVTIDDIRPIGDQYLASVKPQADAFILAQFWTVYSADDMLNVIRREVVNENVSVEHVVVVNDMPLINVFLGPKRHSLVSLLVDVNRIGQRIDVKHQRELMETNAGDENGSESPAASSQRETFTSNLLNIGSEQEVICSHVQDGPFLFSIQLASEITELQSLMTDMIKRKLTQLTEKPVPGMACLVRFRNQIYRAMIISVTETTCNACLVDYGSCETVPLQQLFAISSPYLKRKIFAMRSTLSGHKKLNRNNRSVKDRFVELIGHRQTPFRVKVVPYEGTPAVHYCEVLVDGVNVFEELLRVQSQPAVGNGAGKEMGSLNANGFVRVIWIHSVKRFFVMFTERAQSRDKLLKEFGQYCESEAKPLTEIRIGALCGVRWKADQTWNRAKIMDIRKTASGGRTVLVNFIDHGRDVEVGIEQLKRLNGDFSQMPPIVTQCCLEGVDDEPEMNSRFQRMIQLDRFPQRQYKIKVHSRLSQTSFSVDLLNDTQTMVLNSEIKDPVAFEKAFNSLAITNSQLPPLIPLDSSRTKFTLNDDVAVKLTAFHSLDDFYCQAMADEKKYFAFAKALQNTRLAQLPKRGTIGQVVLCRSSEGEDLFRGEIFAYNELLQKFKVIAIDVGSKEIIPQKQVFENPYSVDKHPAFAMRCSLAGRNEQAINNEAQLEEKVAAVLKKAMAIHCRLAAESQDKLKHVKVKVDGRDVMETCGGSSGVASRTTDRHTSTKEMMEENKENMMVSTEINKMLLINQVIWIEPMESQSDDLFVFCLKSHRGVSCKGRSVKPIRVPCLVKVDQYENEVFDLRIIPDVDIAPQPFLSNTFSVTVTSVQSFNRVHVQKIESLVDLTHLLLDMNKHYDVEGSVRNGPVAKDMIMAVKSFDGFWYRAEIIEVQDNDKIHVKLIDYGRDEWLEVTRIRPLVSQFKRLDALATEVHLPIEKFSEKITDEVVTNEVLALTKNISIILKVVENYRGNWIVDLMSNGFSIGEALENKKLAIRCSTATICKQIGATVKDVPSVVAKATKKSVDKGEDVEVSHFDSPDRFFVQLKVDLPKLRLMQENLQIIADSLKGLTKTEVGDYCIARNSFDGQWYRARILDSAIDMTSVQFVDYGNTDVITSDKGAKIKEMMEEFRTIPDFARFCSLPMRPYGNRSEWDDEVLPLINGRLEKSSISKQCQFLSESKLKKHFVRLFIDDEDMEEVLQHSQLGVHINVIPSKAICYVSHINSLSEFFVQLESSSTALDLLREYMKDVESNAVVTEPRVNEIYAAQYLDDVDWYRVRVLKVAEKGGGKVLAHFMDYGNDTEVAELREIAQEIRDIPVLTTRCKLFLPKNVLNISMEAETKFEEVASMGSTIMRAVLVKIDKDVQVVELYVEETGENLLDLLQLKRNPYESGGDLH